MLKNVIIEKIIWICLKNFNSSHNSLHGDLNKKIIDIVKKSVKKN